MSWAAGAECVALIIRGSAEASWWTDDEADPARRGDALRICLACQVRSACLADALHTETGGSHAAHRGTIRGGTTPAERERLSRTVSFDDLRISLRLWCWSCRSPIPWTDRDPGMRVSVRYCDQCDQTEEAS